MGGTGFLLGTNEILAKKFIFIKNRSAFMLTLVCSKNNKNTYSNNVSKCAINSPSRELASLEGYLLSFFRFFII